MLAEGSGGRRCRWDDEGPWSAALVALGLFVTVLMLIPGSALAGPPGHPRTPDLDLAGFNHACGVAVDSQGDVYVASAGESKIRIFNSAHAELGQISTANEPCGLAVDGNGNLYVSEKATGDVVKYVPSVYPFVGPPSYGAPTVVDGDGSPGTADGISVDRSDNRLYVARGDHVAAYTAGGVFEANLGEGDLGDAAGVAAYTSPFVIAAESKATRYLYVADLATDEIKVFSGTVANASTEAVADPELRRTIPGVDHDDNPETPLQLFEFGSAGAYLSVDAGNRNSESKCTSVNGQACTAGHFLVYDSGNDAVDEFDASGEFLDQIPGSELGDAEPTAMAVERSGGANDGSIYITSGAGAGADLLAFAPLAAPARAEFPESTPPSQVLPNARAIATDSFGNVYAAADSLIHVYSPAGQHLTTIEDTNIPLEDLAVDSTGKVFVLESGEVTYYTPGAYPPQSGTTYSRHEPLVVSEAGFSDTEAALAIEVNPGPGVKKDHLYVTGVTITHEYDSAANGSVLLNDEFADEQCQNSSRRSIGVYGRNGSVYFGLNPPTRLCIVDASGEHELTQIDGGGSPQGKFLDPAAIAVDQSNGHVLAFSRFFGAVREYDASGAFVAEFGTFTKTLVRVGRVAVDNSCDLQVSPLTESTTPACSLFNPSSGNAYVAFDDKPGLPDIWAFDRLEYGEPPVAVTGTASDIGGGAATLNGTVDPRGFELSQCEFEYISDEDYVGNSETFAGAQTAACVPGLVEIGKGTGSVAVHADISGLDPGERYWFRLAAANKFGPAFGAPMRFGPPFVVAKPALPVLYDEATLRASVDSGGLETQFHFEYGKQAGEYDQSTPVETLAAGSSPVEVEAALTGLEEGTEYHFVVIATNEAGAGESLDMSFTTSARPPAQSCPNEEYRIGLSAGLPDCRAYELITPAETNGLIPYAADTGDSDAGFNNWLVLPRGTGAGETVSYFTDGTLPGFDGNGRRDGYRAHRGAGDHPATGWSTELFGLSFVQAGGFEPRQRGVSADQRYSFWLTDPLEVLAGTLPEGFYLQMPGDATPGPCNPVPTQSRFELIGCGSGGLDPEAEGRYVGPGGAHVVFESSDHLEGEAAPSGTVALYDRTGGDATAEVISVKPDGSSFAAGENASYVASSEDGATTIFKVGGALYVHRLGQTVQVADAPNTFAGIAADGERVFYAASASGSVPSNIFACDIEAGPCDGAGGNEIAADAIFANVSADGSDAFFISDVALTGSEENDNGESAEASEQNLYAWDGASTRFVAILDADDFSGFGGTAAMNLAAWTAAINPGTSSGRALSPTRSTPDGDVLVFQSHAQLTEYDNEGFGQIYRYDPGADVGERLTCQSCPPGNSPPGSDAMLQDVQGTGITAQTMIPNLTDDGVEVFFQASDPLLPEDANEVGDVYKWTASSPSSSCERSGGCLALISSGQAETPSNLYGMSADGDDVFFSTLEKLVATDVAGSSSIYDARAGGGIPEPRTEPECQGDACQGNGTPPPILIPPASTGADEGNVDDRACPRGRRLVKGHCRASCSKGQRRVKGRCVKPRKRNRDRRKTRSANTTGGAQR